MKFILKKLKNNKLRFLTCLMINIIFIVILQVYLQNDASGGKYEM
jgi:hypothetical protein